MISEVRANSDRIECAMCNRAERPPLRGWLGNICRKCADNAPWDIYDKTHGGVQAAFLADVVNMIGPLAAGADGLLWEYRGGVWEPSRNVVRDRVVKIMGDRYRRNFAAVAEDVVRAYAPPITCDPVPGYINFRNGLLDWRGGVLEPHRPGVHSTIQLSVEWAPDAQCPEFDKWLEQVIPADCAALAWELIGYLCYSGNPLHTAVMLTGSGRNGKGTFLRVIKAILGERNVAGVTLADLANPEMRFSTVQLFGKIANIAGDIDSRYLENTARFKAVTGGDLISAEHKGKDAFVFTPWAVPIFSANKIPPSADTTIGYLSRWLVLPFPVSFAGREDRTVEDRLMAELPGIAAKGVRALEALLARGKWELADNARQAQERFEREVDQVKAWVQDCTVPGGWTPRTQLYTAYVFWAQEEGIRSPVRRSEMYRRLEAMEVRSATRRGTRGYELELAAEGARVRWAGQPGGGTVVTFPAAHQDAYTGGSTATYASANGHGYGYGGGTVVTFPGVQRGRDGCS